MSHPNQPHNHYQPPSQGCPQYPPPHYPSTVYQDPQARDHMNPQGRNPTNNYADPRLSAYPQPPPLQSNATHHQPQQQTQQDHNRQAHQVLYIPTPPPVTPGKYQNPNPSPFTTTPRTAVQTTSPQSPRYQCAKCGTTFSRQHDRNRHYETTHSDNPPVHKCENCSKHFSRADAKKRHQGDGKCVSSQ